jgi:hypothetical protein
MAAELVKMSKGEETIEVHPSCVADHQSLGWSIVNDESFAAETSAAEPPTKKKK